MEWHRAILMLHRNYFSIESVEKLLGKAILAALSALAN
jgi:hypothetical protein